MALYNELDEAVGVADQTTREARAKSIDPPCRDGIAERSRAEDQEFIAQRLRNAATPLREKYQQAFAREQTEVWNKSADDVEMQVAQVADQLIEIYPMATNLLVQLFKTMVAVDKKVDSINSTAPNGTMRRLKSVEAVARKIPTAGNPLFVEQVKLPTLVTGYGTAADAWPPPRPNVGLQYYEMVAAHCRGETLREAPEPMRAGETEYEYTLRQQQKRVEASRRLLISP